MYILLGGHNIQETQLLLTNRATRLEVNQFTKHGTIPYVRLWLLISAL